MTEEKKSKIKKGGFNLAWLGVISIVIATITTGVSLIIYHNSGDIYLDRSRPGFLPDEEEIEHDGEKEEDYLFDKTGKLTIKDIEQYLEKINVDVKAIDSYQQPFSQKALSDDSLDIIDK